MTFPLQRNAKAYYGDPTVNNKEWQARNLVLVPVPWATYYDGKRVNSVRVHRLVAGSLIKVFDNAWKAIGKDQAKAVARGWAVYNGSYAYRPIRGAKTISNHSFGAALDFDAANNGLNSSPTDSRGFTSSDPLVKAFIGEGWRWGGNYKGRTDPMHFEAVSG